jgi:hypothetical protein
MQFRESEKSRGLPARKSAVLRRGSREKREDAI